jgi:hypothetical protein
MAQCGIAGHIKLSETSSAIWSYNINWLTAIFGSRPCSRPCCLPPEIDPPAVRPREQRPVDGVDQRNPLHCLPAVSVWRGDYVAVNREAREAALRESYFAAWRLRLKARDWV